MNGSSVAAFEKAFASYVGARYAIAMCNGTATLHTALAALGVKPGDRVAVPPLTMSATTMAVLHAGAVPVFCDVSPKTWIMDIAALPLGEIAAHMPVSLYGLHAGWSGATVVDDAAQTLRPHGGGTFTSYSFQSSKVLALGEGGMLVTDDHAAAMNARSFSSLGYRMRADQPRIDPAVLKDPQYERHHSMGWNYRMNDTTAMDGLYFMDEIFKPIPDTPGGMVHFENGLDALKDSRRHAARFYREAITGCSWITPQHVPEGWTHDYWCFAVALEHRDMWHPFVDRIVKHGGERPYAAWRLTYQEPAFRHLAEDGYCPVAESLQPRLIQFQTNNIASAERNADAVAKAIKEING